MSSEAYRLDNFVIGLTNDDPATTAPVFKSSYTVCAQFSGSVAASENATVVCWPSSKKFRFVVVHGSLTRLEALCIAEVYVYARYYRKHKPILIQQHVDDSSFFDRSWNEFRVGFGNRNGNFWMGNEWIHKLTKDGECKLRIDVQQANTLAWFWAEYRTFIVDSENNIYQLTVTGFSGNVNYDALGSHNGFMFATFDRDVADCLVSYKGGFWYGVSDCGGARVNAASHGFAWSQLPGGDTLMYSQMWLECP